MNDVSSAKLTRFRSSSLVRTIVRAVSAVIVSLSLLHSSSAVRAEDDDPKDRAELLEKTLRRHVKEPRALSVLHGVSWRHASERTRRIVRRLLTRKIDVEFDHTSADEALRTLREVCGVPILVSAKAKKQLAEETPVVRMKLEKLRAHNVLNLVATHLGDVHFRVRYGAVILAATSEYRPRRVSRVLDVRDLVRRRPDFKAPRLGLGGTEE